MAICKHCRFWMQLDPNEKYGDCQRIVLGSPSTSDAPAIMWLGEYGDVDLMTKADFGCVLFEQSAGYDSAVIYGVPKHSG